MSKLVSQAKSIALSDVDGTIVRGSLVLNHAVALHKEKVVDLGDLPKRWLNDKKNETLISNLAEAYRDGISGKTTDEIMVEDYIKGLVSDGNNFYSTLARLEKMKASGSDVLLISGSPDFLVGEFAHQYGFEAAASVYAKDANGRFTGDCQGMFSGGAKRTYLSSLNLSAYSNVVAFGDTCSDEPLFDNAHYSVLVEPNAETRAALQHKVDEVIHH